MKKEDINPRLSRIETKVDEMYKRLCGNGQPGFFTRFDNFMEEYYQYREQDAKWKGIKDGSIISLKWAIGIGFTILSLFLTYLIYCR